ncbi:hypothetical protein NST84_03700 [Paenibacillus sp. FSL R7-0345]|uniref:hypothetical protein n=1 Tax=Paenibacillus sp. FSL R7-0345 TaxID=2954535 RepID=UPI00315B0251
MNLMKRSLQAHRPVFVAGMPGMMERYQLFRGLVGTEFRGFLPVRESDVGTEIPLFFFPGGENRVWAELDSGDYVPFPLQTSSSPHVTGIYFSVSQELLPSGFIFIMLPFYKRSFDWDFSFEERYRDWMKPDSRLLWFDCFPYAEENQLVTMSELRSKLNPLNTTVGLLRSGRRFGYSDLTGEEIALIQANQNWITQGSCDGTAVIESELSRELFTSILYRKRVYSLPIHSIIKADIGMKHRIFRKNYTIDFEEQILEELTAGFIEPIFGYKGWIKESADLVAGWNKQARKLLLPHLNELLMALAANNLYGTEVYDWDKLMKAKLESAWKKGFKYISSNCDQDCLLLKGIGELQYMAAIKKVKGQYIEAMQFVLSEIICSTVEELLEQHYDLWNRLA